MDSDTTLENLVHRVSVRGEYRVSDLKKYNIIVTSVLGSALGILNETNSSFFGSSLLSLRDLNLSSVYRMSQCVKMC